MLQSRGNWQTIDSVQRLTNPSALADLAGYAPYLDARQKLELLETPDVDTRLERLVEWVRAHIADMQVSEKIQNDVREGMEKPQRSSCCASSWPRSAGSWARMTTAARTTVPAPRPRTCPRRSARPRVPRDRPARGDQRAEPEGGWIRTWLDTVLELPWNVRTGDNDVVAARAVLDADHYGLADVKDRMIEHLAVRARRAARAGAGRRPRVRRCPGSRRAARRRQDQPR